MWAQGRLGAFFVFIFLCVPRRQLSAGWMWREITADITLTTTTPNISAELQAASQPIARLSLIFTQCHDLRLRTENSCEHDSYPLSPSSLSLLSLQFSFTFFSICWTSHFLQPPFSVSPRLDAHLFVGRRLYVSVHMLDDPNRTSRILLRCVCASRICLSLSIYACVCVCLN